MSQIQGTLCLSRLTGTEKEAREAPSSQTAQRSFGPEDKLHPYSTLVLFRSLKSARPKNPAAGTGKPGHVLRGPYGCKQHRSAKSAQGRQAENWQATTGTQVSSRLS